MPTVQPIRPPPPSLHASPAPADFDATMATRWHTWQLHGQAQSRRTKARARALFAVASLAGIAAVARHLIQQR